MLRTTLLALFSMAVMTAGAKAVTVYSDDGSSTTGWSSNVTTSTTPGTASHAADEFLGRFGNGNADATLSLTGLAAHSSVTVSFDVYMIQSTDGNGPDGGGPDPWGVGYSSTHSGGTQSLIETNFNNYDLDNNNTQSFGGSNGSGGYLTGGTYAGYTGAAEKKTLGYIFNGEDMDSVYHLSFTFNDSDADLDLLFTSAFNEDLNTNESWGLDNVVVSTNADAGVATPLPSAAWVGLPMLAAVGLMAKRRRLAQV